MGISLERTVYTGRKQAFWRGEAKMLPGGYHIQNNVSVGTVIKRGAFVAIDNSDLLCTLVKVGAVLKGGTTSKPRVAKDNYFEIGDTVMKVGGSGTTITGIDRSNSEYDELTLAAAITGLKEGDFIQEAEKNAEGDTYSAKAIANTVVGADKVIKTQGSMTLDIAYEVLVIKDNVPAFPSEWIAENGFHLATNPNIRFIKQ